MIEPISRGVLGHPLSRVTTSVGGARTAALTAPKITPNSTLAPMVNRVLTSPYLWWFDPLPVAPSVPRPQLKVLAF
ncbi:hypothetical protein ABIE49_004380 [Bradyrhizobium sp. OAE829]